MIEPEELFEIVFNHSTYKKGGEYSASDITGEPLIALLKHNNPNLPEEIATKDKTSSVLGTSFHEFAESAIKSTDRLDVETEVKLKFKNLSGTADLVLDGTIVADWKTGTEKTISAKIKNPEAWITQISIYSYLLSKTKKQPMTTIGYILWFAVDTKKYGVLKLDLLTKEETISTIKTFMENMKKEPTDFERCEGCLYWLNRWCGVKSVCHHWDSGNDPSVVDEW